MMACSPIHTVYDLIPLGETLDLLRMANFPHIAASAETTAYFSLSTSPGTCLSHESA